MSQQKKQTPLQLYWIMRRDMTEVLDIERDSFDSPWSDDDFDRCLLQRNCFGMVAKHEERVVGYIIYNLQKTRFDLLNFAVAKAFRRRGVGSRMLNRLKGKLNSNRRTAIFAKVRETNLDALFFFRDLGFKAVDILRDHYEETDDDAYVMRHRIDIDSVAPANRISHLFS